MPLLSVIFDVRSLGCVLLSRRPVKRRGMWHFVVTELCEIQKRKLKTAKMKNFLLVSSRKERKIELRVDSGDVE